MSRARPAETGARHRPTRRPRAAEIRPVATDDDDRFRFGHTAGGGRRLTAVGRAQRATEPETVQGPVDDAGRVHGVLDGQRRPLDTVQHHIQHHGQVLRRVQLRRGHHVHHIHDRVRAPGHTGVLGARPAG